jgi:GT2 family glycosyltransferase
MTIEPGNVLDVPSERELYLLAMTPFDVDGNLGRAYNRAMELLPDDAWACFTDHDSMFATREWYVQLIEAITLLPDAGLFTAVTNRIGAKWQRAEETDRHNHDMLYHWKIGHERLKKRTLLDVTDTKGIGGVLMCLSKRAWREVGGFVDGMLCVDHQMHFALRAVGRRVYLLESLYVYHLRRAGGYELPENMPRAPNCQCRGLEHMPSQRIGLPRQP